MLLRFKTGIYYTGISTTEYAICISLVLILSIGALDMLSTNINATLLNIHGGMSVKKPVTKNSIVSTINVEPGIKVDLTKVQFTPEQIELLKASMNDKVQTSGANGATEVLAMQIMKVANNLKEKNKISSEQYATLRDLANQGFQIADIQTCLAQALEQSNGNIQKFNSLKIALDGKMYTTEELSNMIGFDTYGPSNFSNTDVLTTNDRQEAEISKLMTLYKEVLDSGALIDPEASDTVKSAMTQIVSIGEAVENSMSEYRNGIVVLKNETDLNIRAASATTNMRSSNICTAGNFSTDGITCSL